MNLSKRAIAEFLGTFWLVFGGCGSAVLAAAFPQLGIGFYGVVGIWTDRTDDGLRDRAHFGMPSQSGSLLWPGGR